MTGENGDDEESIGDRLRRLLNRLDRGESLSGRGSVDGNGYSIDFDVDVRSLDGGPGDAPTNRGDRRRRQTRSHEGELSREADGSSQYAVSVRDEGDTLAATVDLGPGWGDADVSARVDDGTLVVRDETVLATVPLPVGDAEVTDTSLNNGVLVVRVDDRANGGDDV